MTIDNHEKLKRYLKEKLPDNFQSKKIDFSKYLIREFLAKVVLFWFTIPLVSFYFLYQKYVAREVNPILLHDNLLNTRIVKAQEK